MNEKEVKLGTLFLDADDEMALVIEIDTSYGDKNKTFSAWHFDSNKLFTGLDFYKYFEKSVKCVKILSY